jgi:superfamily II DNA or RNA helicase
MILSIKKILINKLIKMALVVPTDDAVLAKLKKDLTIKIEIGGKFFGNAPNNNKNVYLYLENGPNRPCSIPFNYGINFSQSRSVPDTKKEDGIKLALKKNIATVRPSRNTLGNITHSFEGSLRGEQRKCRNEALGLLQKHKSVMLSCYTGFGKTVTAINMASKIKLKTFIVVPKKPLLSQWESEIRKFIPKASVMVIEPGKIKNMDTLNTPDFCIVNACNIHKLAPQFLKIYGFVVVDEAHLQMTEKLSKNLLCLTPRYLLGITATPYRDDGYNVFFKLFFGKEMVQYTLNKKHTVYAVKTGFSPNENKYLKTGPNYKQKVDWNIILDEQARDETRNQLIINIVREFKDRVFLILVKRVEHGQHLLDSLEKLGERVTSLLGKQQVFDKDARILIGTNSKIGTGFDHPRLDTLLAAADMVSYYIQFIGRVMRRKDVEPIIFDLVDSHPTLKKHFEKRSKVYCKHGGEIVKFKLKN